MDKLPSFLQPILWSSNIDNLDTEKYKPYIVHQTLAYGSLQAIRWLKDYYSEDSLKYIFKNYPYKDYSAARFNFVKDFILKLQNYKLNEALYVKNIPRSIR